MSSVPGPAGRVARRVGRASVAGVFVLLAVGGCARPTASAPSAAVPGPAPDTAPDSPALRWFKGNTHTHTLESDGDSPPEVVVRWYRDHDYDFLVLSDHNVFTDPEALAHLTDSTFLLIPGEEVTSAFRDRPVHVNGLGIPEVVEPRVGETLVATIQENVDAVREVEGVPHINHPNFGWAFGAAELLQIRNDRLLEIYNGHPTVHNHGGGGRPSVEEIWDVLLTAGIEIYGIAVDDAHHFQGEFASDRANPGRGWVAVKAPRLEADAILEALEAGRFYASTGVELDDVVVTPDRLEVRIRPRGNFRHTTTFIGSEGRVLAETPENPAIYRFEGGEGYVRARVRGSGGAVAWVQPVFPDGR